MHAFLTLNSVVLTIETPKIIESFLLLLCIGKLSNVLYITILSFFIEKSITSFNELSSCIRFLSLVLV